MLKLSKLILDITLIALLLVAVMILTIWFVLVIFSRPSYNLLMQNVVYSYVHFCLWPNKIFSLSFSKHAKCSRSVGLHMIEG